MIQLLFDMQHFMWLGGGGGGGGGGESLSYPLVFFELIVECSEPCSDVNGIHVCNAVGTLYIP